MPQREEVSSLASVRKQRRQRPSCQEATARPSHLFPCLPLPHHSRADSRARESAAGAPASGAPARRPAPPEPSCVGGHSAWPSRAVARIHVSHVAQDAVEIYHGRSNSQVRRDLSQRQQSRPPSRSALHEPPDAGCDDERDDFKLDLISLSFGTRPVLATLDQSTGIVAEKCTAFYYYNIFSPLD